MMEFSDRLHRAVLQAGTPLCVGLDPHLDQLPAPLVRRHIEQAGDPATGYARATETFLLRIMDRIAPLVAVIKPQWAFFEQLGPQGMMVLRRICSEARDRGLLVLADAKRGDIGSTAEAYARTFFEPADPSDCRVPPPMPADAVTLNPYLGSDAIIPFIRKNPQHGVFILVRTSNASGDEIQNLPVDDHMLQEHVARYVHEWGRSRLGECGWSSVGAVVGATYPEEAERLRRLMPDTPFLIPGFGAQGGSADAAVTALRRDGSGGIVNSSRAILFAYRKAPYAGQFGEDAYDRAAEAACRDAVCRINEALHMKKPGE
ncbi:MAG TPA: orotidine-5'-phosphate decarboxylase [bacterium]|nr:orotidine-5'-phosphate decarboxylase [bacterium]